MEKGRRDESLASIYPQAVVENSFLCSTSRVRTSWIASHLSCTILGFVLKFVLGTDGICQPIDLTLQYLGFDRLLSFNLPLVARFSTLHLDLLSVDLLLRILASGSRV